MKPTRIWPDHVTIPELGNLVLLRSPSETLSATLAKLERIGVSTEDDAIEVHGEIAAA